MKERTSRKEGANKSKGAPVQAARENRPSDDDRNAQPICGLATEGRFEAIYYNGFPAFLVFTRKGRFEVLSEVTIDGRKCRPPSKDRLPYKPYEFNGNEFSGPVPSATELYARVKCESQKYSDMDLILHIINAAVVMISYMQHQFEALFILHVIGDNETGKTIVCDLHKAISYRPLKGTSFNDADIYGFLDQGHTEGCGTIIEDEIDGLERDKRKLKIYKVGYRSGAHVPRYRETGSGMKLQYFPSYCLKIVAGERLFSDKGLNQRAILMQMMPGQPPMSWPDNRKQRELDHDALRKELLRWRLANYDESLPDLKEPELNGRLREIFGPLLQVLGVTNEDDRKALLDYISNIKNDRLNDLQSTLEGHIVKVIWKNLRDTDETIVTSNELWSWLSDDLNGISDEYRPHVMHTSELGEITKSRVGYRVREILDAKRKIRIIDGRSVRSWEFNREKLKKVAQKYGYN